MCVMRVTEHQDELHLLSLGQKLDPVHVLMCLLSVHENVLASEDFQMKQKNVFFFFFRIISFKWHETC